MSVIRCETCKGKKYLLNADCTRDDYSRAQENDPFGIISYTVVDGIGYIKYRCPNCGGCGCVWKED